MVGNSAETGDGAPKQPSWSTIPEATEVFSAARPRLFGIAYRMLGSVSEAEDIVQESWLRWQATDRSVVENPNAFLATITTRLAMNLAQSARARHETYIGPWLPDPIDTSANPALGAERGEALEYAVLILLEKLTPAERAAYVLREAFDYPYELIADIVQATEPATRKLVSRARKHLAVERRKPAPAAEHKRLLSAFLTAAQAGRHCGARETVRRRRGELLRRRWCEAGRTHPDHRPHPGGEVRRSVLVALLDRRRSALGRGEWAIVGRALP